MVGNHELHVRFRKIGLSLSAVTTGASHEHVVADTSVDKALVLARPVMGRYTCPTWPVVGRPAACRCRSAHVLRTPPNGTLRMRTRLRQRRQEMLREPASSPVREAMRRCRDGVDM